MYLSCYITGGYRTAKENTRNHNNRPDGILLEQMLYSELRMTSN